MDKMQFQAFGETFKGELKFHEYNNNGNRAVQLMSWNDEYEGWEPFAVLSINTNKTLPEDQFVAKTYSENEGLVEQFIEMGYFEHTGESVAAGYAGAQPILRIVDKEQLCDKYFELCCLLERECVLSDDMPEDELRKLVVDAQQRVDDLKAQGIIK
jgi:hypothetical protein